MNNEFTEIGNELIKASKESSSARGLVEELFPYIYVASKRMSVRAISRWLDETRNIKISHVSISKALKNSDKHFEAILDNIWPAAKVAGQLLNKTAPEVLFELNLGPEGIHLWNIDDTPIEPTDKAFNADFMDGADAILKLRDEWAAYPVQARFECRRFIKNYEDDLD